MLYNITATKRNSGELIEGTTNWDGLSSMFSVTTSNGETKYVSELDEVVLTLVDNNK